MAERGVVVTYETIRSWCEKFGRSYAKRLHHRSAPSGDQWFLDEVFVRINGRQHILLAGCGSGRRCARYPGSITTQYQSGETIFQEAVEEPMRDAARDHDRQAQKLRRRQTSSDAKRGTSPRQRAQQSSGELAPAYPTARRHMRRFKSAKHVQRFLSIFGVIGSYFRVGRHLLSAKNYRELMRRRFSGWADVVRNPAAA